jgi:hypothetical protein
MRSSFVYGYGFIVDEIYDNVLIEFIKNHMRTFCASDIEKEMYEEMLEYTKEEYDLEDFFESYSCDCTGMEGRGAVISNIISRETGIRFDYQRGDGECNSYPSVLFVESYPWNLNEKEKNLTVESLTEIVLPYVEELGLKKNNIDALEIEYYG